MGDRTEDYSSYRGSVGTRRDSTSSIKTKKFEGSWDLKSLPVFEKNFYFEHPEVTKRSNKDCDEWRKNNQLIVHGLEVPKPVFSFEEASLPEYLLSEIQSKFKDPTPIQSQALPIALSGKDLIGISATGSGKTLAFLLPAIVHINSQPYLEKGDGPIVLVLAPTRELACQIKEESDKFGASSGIKNTVVYGGVPKQSQVETLRKGVEIVIATPGRLIDHLESHNTNLRRVTYLVLDEADRMLDMGFEPQIRRIVDQIRPDRQTLMWSATWPKAVESLAEEFLTNPSQIKVGASELVANSNITQKFEILTDYQKFPRLVYHLDQLRTTHCKTIIFVETKIACEELSKSLKVKGYSVDCIHGNKSQAERDFSLQQFRDNNCEILVATDVAGRGLDIREINLVINFDMPSNVEDYIHRIGRTGRGGDCGRAISFFTEKSSRLAEDLARLLELSGQKVPEQFQEMIANQNK